MLTAVIRVGARLIAGNTVGEESGRMPDPETEPWEGSTDVKVNIYTSLGMQSVCP